MTLNSLLIIIDCLNGNRRPLNIYWWN